jgi:alpha-tubulin suppressor-like RCC1 family protein
MEETHSLQGASDLLNQGAENPPYTEFFSWGSDSYGQLALANTDDEEGHDYSSQQFSDEPKSLSFDVIISQISCGDHHAAFISGDGLLFSFGKNTEGQLGVGDPSLVKSSAPLLVDSIQSDDRLSIVQVACGGNQSAIVMSNGDLYMWGDGKFGATGLGSG